MRRSEKWLWLRVAGMATWLLCTGTVAAAEPLNVYIGQGQMPHADNKVGNHGLFGELMQAICLRLQRECRYQSVPWKRVQVTVATDPQGIVLNIGRIPEREDALVWLLDVLPTAYVLASRDKTYDTLADALRDGPVVVMGGTPRAQELLAQKQPGQVVVEVTDPEQAARMLHGGRVTAWYEIDLRVGYLWHRLQYPADSMRQGKPIGLSRSYIAGSPLLKDAPAIEAEMQRTFAQMKADGSWQKILSRYLGEDLAAEVAQ